MACPGLHCAGCGAGISVPPIALVYAYGAVWLAGHIVEVAIVSAACGALAVAAVVAIMRWQDRRQAARAARCPLLVTRLDALPPAGRPAIGPAVVNMNFYGIEPAAQAEVARREIERASRRPSR